MLLFRTQLRLSLLCLTVSALSLSAVPFLNLKQPDVWLYTVAGLFWGGLLAGLLIFAISSVRFRKYRNWVYKKRLLKRQPLPGILTFRNKPLHLALYAVIAVGILCAVTDLIKHWAPNYIMFPILSLTMIAFALHCFLDGRNYQAYAKLKEGKKYDGHK